MYKKIREVVFPIDYFRTTPGLNFKKSSHFSFCGSLLSIMLYTVLAAYFLWQIVAIATKPLSESRIQSGQMDEPIDYSNFSICQTFKNQRDGTQFIKLYKILDDFSFEPIPQESINILNSPNGNGMYTSCLSLKETTIGTRIGGIRGLRVDVNSIQKSMDLGPGQLEAFTLNMYYHQYNPEDTKKPLESRSISNKFLTTKSGSESNYHFNYVIYEIQDGIFWSSLEQRVKSLSFTLVSDSAPETPFHDAVNFIFDGEVITNIRSFKKVTEVFSAVIGLKAAIVLVVAIFFGQYFEFKYYENLINNSRRYNRLQENEVFLDIPAEERQALQKKVKSEQDQSLDNEEIQLSYLQFMKYKMAKILKKTSYKYDKTCEILESQKQNIQEQLDVVNVLYQLNEVKKFRSELDGLKSKMNNIEKLLEEVLKDKKN